MCSCGSGGGGPQAQYRAAAAIAEMLPPEFDTFVEGLGSIQDYVEKGQTVRVKYVGDAYGAITYRGKITRNVYRAGQEQGALFNDVDPRDVEGLIMTNAFQVVNPEAIQ